MSVIRIEHPEDFIRRAKPQMARCNPALQSCQGIKEVHSPLAEQEAKQVRGCILPCKTVLYRIDHVYGDDWWRCIAAARAQNKEVAKGSNQVKFIHKMMGC